MAAHLGRLLSPLGLFLLNAWLIRELFTLEYGVHMGSIEPTYISLARFLMEQWPDISWFRFWYGGVPLENTYPPLLNWVVAGWSILSHSSPALAYHQVVAVVYSAAPVTLYLLAVRLGSSRRGALLAGVTYSVLSPAALLIDEVRIDVGGPWYPRRFENLLPYGEGPHETALFFLPLAILALDRVLEKRTPARLVAAALAVAAVVASNWLGTSALAISVVCLWLARGLTWKAVRSTALAVLLGYCLICVFFPPRNILLIQHNSRLLNVGYSTLHSLLPAVLVAALCLYGLHRLSAKLGLTPAVRFFLYASTIFTTLVLGQFWFGIIILPQASRYQLEMDSALVFFFALAIYALARRAPFALQVVFLLVAIAGGVHQILFTRLWCRSAVIPIDVTQTLEYQTAMWARTNVQNTRIYLSGSPSYWLSAWTDTPQLEGDFNNGITDWNVWIADSVALHSPPEETLLWLKAFGVGYVEMVGGKSRGIFHYMQNPGKFDGLLPVARREGEDVIYRIDGPAAYPAHLLPREALLNHALLNHAPQNPADVAELRRFVHAIETSSAPLPTLTWTSNHSFDVQANLRPGDLLSVSECFYPGWRASINDHQIPLTADGLGLMVATPNRVGATTIRFEYSPSRIPLILTAIAWLSCFAILIANLYSLFRSLATKRDVKS